MPECYSPLRYPGGKTKLYPLVLDIISINDLLHCTYIEPFAGGAGLALKLLMEGKVDNIVLNDYDHAIYCIWDTILNHSDCLCDFIERVPLSTTEWQRQKETYNNQEYHTNLEIGEASFYLNRTNISGILNGGIIGGYAQEGMYKIDARFNRNNLISIITNISKFRNNITLYNYDAIHFTRNIIPNYLGCFVYFDPPYVKKGHLLYKNSLKIEDHIRLQSTISQCKEKWIATYDNCEFIKNLYSDYYVEELSINYSIGQSRTGSEVLIYGGSTLRIDL